MPFAGPIFLFEQGTPFHNNTKNVYHKRIWVEHNRDSNELMKANTTQGKVTIAQQEINCQFERCFIKRKPIFSITKRQSIFLLIVSPKSTKPSDPNEFFISTIETRLISLLSLISVSSVEFWQIEQRNKNMEIKIVLFLEFMQLFVSITV